MKNNLDNLNSIIKIPIHLGDSSPNSSNFDEF